MHSHEESQFDEMNLKALFDENYLSMKRFSSSNKNGISLLVFTMLWLLCGRLIIATVGDSQAILYLQWKAQLLTNDRIPSLIEEKTSLMGFRLVARSTSIVALLKKECVRDGRAILCQEGKAPLLTNDHTLSSTEEMESCAGYISKNTQVVTSLQAIFKA